MRCQAYVTGERYNILGIHNYLRNMAKYQATFIPEGKNNYAQSSYIFRRSNFSLL